jgi:hypothetical protein
VIELPVTVWAKPDEVVEGVHDRERGVSGEGSHGAPVTNLDVLVVTAVLTSIGLARMIEAACVLPNSLQPVHRVAIG